MIVGERLRRAAPEPSWTDERLIRKCIEGSEEAWSALIARYEKLVFSIPVKLGFSREDAAEIFQQVCMGLIRELPRLRDPKSLPAWLIRVTSRACYELNRREHRYETVGDVNGYWKDLTSSDTSDALVREAEKEQMLRDAIAEARPRCRHLIGLLFFESPPLPYEEVARRLGIATGSVGFIRMRCLQKLRANLEKKGF